MTSHKSLHHQYTYTVSDVSLQEATATATANLEGGTHKKEVQNVLFVLVKHT